MMIRVRIVPIRRASVQTHTHTHLIFSRRAPSFTTSGFLNSCLSDSCLLRVVGLWVVNFRVAAGRVAGDAPFRSANMVSRAFDGLSATTYVSFFASSTQLHDTWLPELLPLGFLPPSSRRSLGRNFSGRGWSGCWVRNV